MDGVEKLGKSSEQVQRSLWALTLLCPTHLLLPLDCYVWISASSVENEHCDRLTMSTMGRLWRSDTIAEMPATPLHYSVCIGSGGHISGLGQDVRAQTHPSQETHNKSWPYGCFATPVKLFQAEFRGHVVSGLCVPNTPPQINDLEITAWVCEGDDRLGDFFNSL